MPESLTAPLHYPSFTQQHSRPSEALGHVPLTLGVLSLGSSCDCVQSDGGGYVVIRSCVTEMLNQTPDS